MNCRLPAFCLAFISFFLTSSSAFTIGIDDYGNGLYSFHSDPYTMNVDMNSTPLIRAIMRDDDTLSTNVHLALTRFVSESDTIQPEFTGHELIGNRLVLYGNYSPGDQSDQLELVQYWEADRRGLIIENLWIATDTTHVLHEALLSFPNAVDSVARFINTANAIEVTAGQQLELSTQAGFTSDYDDCSITTITNPVLGDWTLSGNTVDLRVMRVFEPRAYGENFPDAHSVLAPGDTVRRRMNVLINDNMHLNEDELIVYPSPHRGANESTISFMLDDIPFNWSRTFATHANDPDAPVQAALVYFLNKFPQLRLTPIILFNSMIEWWNGVYAPDSTGWYMNNGNISFVDHFAELGNRSCRMQVNTDTSCRINQRISLFGNRYGELLVNVFVPKQLKNPEPVQLRMLNPDDQILAEGSFAVPLNQWIELSLPFQTTYPGRYQAWIELDHAGGTAFFDNIRLSGNGLVDNDSLSNPSFEWGRCYIQYESDGDHRTNAYTDARIANWGEDYCAYIDRLITGETLYGYEDRMGTGLHGWQHTDDLGVVFELGIERIAEFGRFHPEDDYLTFKAIANECYEMNWDTDIVMLAFRTPGIRYQHSTIQTAIKFGTGLMDKGIDLQNNNFFVVYGPHDQLFMQSHCWWADYPGQYSLDPTWREASQGQILLWGSHPGAMLGKPPTPDRIAWFEGVLTDVMDTFPHMAWERTGDIPLRLEAISKWRNWRWDWQDENLTVHFDGSATMPTTLICMHDQNLIPNQQAQLDSSTTCEVVSRDGKAFVFLPPINDGAHSVTLSFLYTDVDPPVTDGGLTPGSYDLTVYPNPTNGELRINWDIYGSGNYRIEMWNLLGQRVLRKELNLSNGPLSTTLTMPELPSGQYLLQLKQPGSGITKHKRVTIIK